MDELVSDIKSWLHQLPDRAVIGVSGHGAAGKSTFSAMLVKDLGEEETAYLNADPYIITDVRKYTKITYSYKGKEHQAKMTACHPNAHNLLALERDIRMLRDGLELYTMEVPYLETTHLTPKRFTVVDGMSVAFADSSLFDLRIFLYTDAETELMRRTSRDIAERGGNMEHLRRSHEQRRIQYELFMHPHGERFDVVVKSTGEGITVEKNSLF